MKQMPKSHTKMMPKEHEKAMIKMHKEKKYAKGTGKKTKKRSK